MGLKIIVISHYDLDKYYKDIQNFWKENISVEEVNFSTCIDEDGDMFYTSQFIYREV